MPETINRSQSVIASVSAANREARHGSPSGAIPQPFAPRVMHPSLLSELRKRQALHLVEQGYSSRDVAQRLGLAETTVQRLRQGRIPLDEDRDDERRQQRVWCPRCRCHVFAPCQRCRLREYEQRHHTVAKHARVEAKQAAACNTAQAEDPRLALGVAQLGLPVRTVNYLAQAEILTVWDLLQRTPQQILRLPNMGPRTLEMIFAALARLGFHRRGATEAKEASKKHRRPTKAGRRSRRNTSTAARRKRPALTRRGSARGAALHPPARRPHRSHQPR